MNEFLVKLGLSTLLTFLLKGGVALFGHSIAWWLATIISLALVFGGWFIFIDTDGGFE